MSLKCGFEHSLYDLERKDAILTQTSICVSYMRRILNCIRSIEANVGYL